METKNIRYLIIFFALCIAAFYVLYLSQKGHRDDILAQEREILLSTYNNITKSYKSNSEIFFSTKINSKNIFEIMERANSADENLKNKAREELYSALISDYSTMKLFGIRQLHFHLPNNESFLRFHRPEQYGDSLTGIRNTVAYVNKYKEPISGFEEGRIYNGYRYIYPILDGSEHYGSVEISVSMQELLKNLRHDAVANAGFIIKKDVVEQKVFKNEQKNYSPSGISREYLYDNSVVGSDTDLLENLCKKHTDLKKNILKGDIFNFYDIYDSKVYITTFLPIINKYSGVQTAYIIISRPNLSLEYLMKKETFIDITTFFFIALLIFFYYRIQKNEESLKNKNAFLEEIQHIAKLGSWEYDALTHEVKWSDEVYSILGKEPHSFKLTYNGFLGFVHPDDVQKIEEAFFDSINKKEKYSVQHRIIKTDGSFIHVNESGYHIYDHNGDHIKTKGTVHDVSDIVKYEQRIKQMQNELESVVNHIPDIIFKCKNDENLTMLYVNNAIEKITGYKAEGFIEGGVRNYRDIIDADDRKEVYQKIKSSLEYSSEYTLEYRIVNSIGDVIWVKESGRSGIDNEGEEIIEGIISDITFQKDSIDKLRKFIDTQDSMVLLTDLNKIIFANRKFFDFFGYDDTRELSKETHCICDLFIEDDSFFHKKKMLPKEDNWVRSIMNLPGRERVVSMLDNQGKSYAFSVAINNYDPHTFIISFSNISDTMFEKLQLKNKAVKDQLTGAYNRTFFDSYISDIIALNQNKHIKTGVIMFDIDDFKKINDNFGHFTGDGVLKELVDIVSRFTRKDDKLIRWGGEEFIIIVGSNDADDIIREAEHLRIVIQNHDFKEVGKVTCSFGTALHDEATTIENSIKKADEKLYEAKKAGKNQVKS